MDIRTFYETFAESGNLEYEDAAFDDDTFDTLENRQILDNGNFGDNETGNYDNDNTEGRLLGVREPGDFIDLTQDDSDDGSETENKKITQQKEDGINYSYVNPVHFDPAFFQTRKRKAERIDVEPVVKKMHVVNFEENNVDLTLDSGDEGEDPKKPEKNLSYTTHELNVDEKITIKQPGIKVAFRQISKDVIMVEEVFDCLIDKKDSF